MLLGKVAFTKQALFIKILLNPNSSNSFFNILANSICDGVDGIVSLASSERVLNFTYFKNLSFNVTYFFESIFISLPFIKFISSYNYTINLDKISISKKD